MDKIEILTYTDYREYLKDAFCLLKNQNPKYSHRFIAQKIGASSAGWFSDIVAGRINCTEKFICKLAQFFKLTEKQSEYFELLIRYNQAGSIEEKENFFKKLRLFTNSNSKIIFADHFAYYRKWYIPAIRELLAIENFSDDYKVLSQKLHPTISIKEAKEAIDILISTNLIYKNTSGFYKPGHVNTIKDSSPSISWASYMSENILLAKDAIFNVPKQSRDISSITIPLSKDSFDIACQKIMELRRYLLSLSENDAKSDTIFQVNFQLFPLTQSKSKEN